MTIPNFQPGGRILTRKTAYKGPVFDVEQLTIETPARQVIERDLIRHAEAVVILAITADQRAIVTHEYRIGAGGEAYALPAGLINAGESPEDAAVRELQEETGYVVKSLAHMTTVRSSEGMTDERVHLFVADIDPKPTKATDFDEDEYVESELVDFDELTAAVRDGRIASAQAVSALSYYLAFVKNANRE